MVNVIIEVYHTLYQTYGPQGWWPVGGTYFPEQKDIYEIIAGAVLTQNTSWKNASQALKMLRQKGLLDPERIASLPRNELASIIRPSGYYNQKAERLIAVTTLYLQTDKDGRLPTREELLTLKGIGPETADSILLYAFNEPVFVVDAYTKRIFRRMGVLKGENSYEEVQEVFMKNLPPDEKLYNEYHALIVRHAKDVCRKNPLCSMCVLSKKEFCNYTGTWQQLS